MMENHNFIASKFQVRFVVDPSAVPAHHISRRIPVALKREVAGKLTDLERNGIMVKKQPVQTGSAIIVIVAAKNWHSEYYA